LVANLKLSDVKKVYIEIRGDAEFNDLRNNLAEKLGSSGVVTSATGVDDADAALKIVVAKISTSDPQGKTQIELSARLVNARGTVLWPKAGARRYSGDTNKAISEMISDLLNEIKLARAAH
jgi:hypothetical protein